MIVTGLLLTLVLVLAVAWWFGRPVPRSGGPLSMGDITYSSLACDTGDICTSADAMLRNTGEDDLTIEGVELVGLHGKQGIAVGSPQLYQPNPDLVGSTKKGYPPPGAVPSNLQAAHGAVIPPGQKG